MHARMAETLLITSRCSAGCRPCPFGNGSLEQRYLDAKGIFAKLRDSKFPLVIISGGEPLEHPQFTELIQELKMKPFKIPPFRIATGGHQSLSAAAEILAEMTEFEGFSIGTDVLSPVCPSGDAFAPIWKENVQLLNQHGMPYSLSLTLHKDILTPTNVIQKAFESDARPEFVYLRVVSRNTNLQGLEKNINKTWPKAKIIIDYLYSSEKINSLKSSR